MHCLPVNPAMKRKLSSLSTFDYPCHLSRGVLALFVSYHRCMKEGSDKRLLLAVDSTRFSRSPKEQRIMGDVPSQQRGLTNTQILNPIPNVCISTAGSEARDLRRKFTATSHFSRGHIGTLGPTA